MATPRFRIKQGVLSNKNVFLGRVIGFREVEGEYVYQVDTLGHKESFFRESELKPMIAR